jgi:hypothetical protein
MIVDVQIKAEKINREKLRLFGSRREEQDQMCRSREQTNQVALQIM